MSPQEADPDKLGDVLQFMRLLWAVAHGLQTVSKRMKRQLGVTGPQRLVIRVIGAFPGTSAGSLAEVLHLHPSTLTGVLRRLETSGLIARTPDPVDRRRSVLTLTARGRALDRVHAESAEAIIRRALQRSTTSDRARARTVLARLADALEEPIRPRRTGAGGRQPSARPRGQAPRRNRQTAW